MRALKTIAIATLLATTCSQVSAEDSDWIYFAEKSPLVVNQIIFCNSLEPIKEILEAGQESLEAGIEKVNEHRTLKKGEKIPICMSDSPAELDLLAEYKHTFRKVNFPGGNQYDMTVLHFLIAHGRATLEGYGFVNMSFADKFHTAPEPRKIRTGNESSEEI